MAKKRKKYFIATLIKSHTELLKNELSKAFKNDKYLGEDISEGWGDG